MQNGANETGFAGNGSRAGLDGASQPAGVVEYQPKHREQKVTL